MRRQLNTLYVTTEGAWLKKDGANVVMEVAGEIRGRLPKPYARKPGLHGPRIGVTAPAGVLRGAGH